MLKVFAEDRRPRSYLTSVFRFVVMTGWLWTDHARRGLDIESSHFTVIWISGIFFYYATRSMFLLVFKYTYTHYQIWIYFTWCEAWFIWVCCPSAFNWPSPDLCLGPGPPHGYRMGFCAFCLCTYVCVCVCARARAHVRLTQGGRV